MAYSLDCFLTQLGAKMPNMSLLIVIDEFWSRDLTPKPWPSGFLPLVATQIALNRSTRNIQRIGNLVIGISLRS